MEMEGTVLIRDLSETALDKGDESSGPQSARAVQASHFVPAPGCPAGFKDKSIISHGSGRLLLPQQFFIINAVKYSVNFKPWYHNSNHGIIVQTMISLASYQSIRFHA